MKTGQDVIKWGLITMQQDTHVLKSEEVAHQGSLPMRMTVHAACLHYNTCKWHRAAAEQTHLDHLVTQWYKTRQMV